jgi:hypothetical protein
MPGWRYERDIHWEIEVAALQALDPVEERASSEAARTRACTLLARLASIGGSIRTAVDADHETR